MSKMAIILIVTFGLREVEKLSLQHVVVMSVQI